MIPSPRKGCCIIPIALTCSGQIFDPVQYRVGQKRRQAGQENQDADGQKRFRLRLQCDQHEFMQAWFLPVTNGHFGVSGGDGSFEIKDVPAGKHKVLAWHPVAGNVTMEVEVKDGGTAEANFDIKKKNKFKGK